MEQKQLIATRVAIVKDKKVLIIREAAEYEEGTNEGKYDLPGGRVDFGETIQEALKRETKEEVGLDVEVVKPFFVGEWRPVVKEVQLQIVSIFFLCVPEGDGEVKLSKDHDRFEWIGRDGIQKFSLLDPVPEVIGLLMSEGVL